MLTRCIPFVLLASNAALAQEVQADQAVQLPEISVTASGKGASAQARARAMDASRDDDLLTKAGATSSSIDREGIDALPQGKDTPLDKLLLQLPGVSYDSAVSNVDFHVRNEYANVQYRIDGILLPEGVSGIGAVLDTGFIGRVNLLDGVLPAQYGLRTAAVVDLTTSRQSTLGGTLGIETGSRATVAPRVEYGGLAGDTEYYVSGRYLRNDEGIENPDPSVTPTHDKTRQARLFAYGSTFLDEATRLTAMAGASFGRYQIPGVAGQVPLGDFGPAMLDSSKIDENQNDRYLFALVALQNHGVAHDAQISAFTRYAQVHFVPDVAGDLAFDDVASDVQRRSLLSGIQFDGAYRIVAAHTLRAGLGVTAERTRIDNRLTVLPLSDDDTVGAVPETIDDANEKLGWNAGAYVQDEWKIRNDLALNTGLRFDYLKQFVTARQLSPRLALVFRPTTDTSLHAGYARYFTPPMQVYAAPRNIALFDGTTEQSVIASSSPVRPERSNYLDVGLDATALPGLTMGVDVYLKRARDFLDDGQFGQTIVYSQFNFARGHSEGVEMKIACRRGDFQGYLNVSANRTRAREVVSNGYLFTDAAEYAYLAKNYIYTDDAQLYSASAGAAYRLKGTLLTISGLYGSGLRSGFANLDHVPGYVQLDLAAAREFDIRRDGKPLTLRASVVNLLDRRYLLRSGDGIGEFAPQFGPRRGFYVSLSQVL